jgi:heme exporter protein B
MSASGIAAKAVLGRDLTLAFRAGGGMGLAAGFFAASAALVPLGVGADLPLLGRIAGGVLWVCATLAALLSLDRLFQADYEDGSLEILALSDASLEAVAAVKLAAHWLTTGLPLIVLSPVLALLFNLPVAGYAPLVLSLLLGTPALSALGSIGAALTLSVRRGGLVLALIVLPLISPAIIFGAASVLLAMQGSGYGAFYWLAAFSVVSVALSPFAAAAAIRLHLGS